MRMLTAEEHAARVYHTRVGEALIAMAWAMRECLPVWRRPAIPGYWELRVATVDAMRVRWRGGARRDDR